jgi:hypothetical protein
MDIKHNCPILKQVVLIVTTAYYMFLTVYKQIMEIPEEMS